MLGQILSYTLAGLVILAAVGILLYFIRNAIRNAKAGCKACDVENAPTSGACIGCPMAADCRLDKNGGKRHDDRTQ